MNRGTGSFRRRRIGGQYGYTIVEVLIFLAVSAVLFGATMTVLSGRQQRVQFTNAVRDFETRIIDVANDVSNGYYQSAGNVGCNASLTISAAGKQGTNEACIILGRVIKLGFDGNAEQYGIYSIVGKRLSAGSDVVDLAQSSPKLLLTSNATDNQSLREQLNVGYGTGIVCIGFNKANCSPSETTNAAIAFVTKLNGGAKPGADGNGITADIYRIQNVSVGDTESVLQTKVSAGNLAKLSPRQTMTVCLRSGGTNQYALVRITNGRVLSEIKETSGGSLCS